MFLQKAGPLFFFNLIKLIFEPNFLRIEDVPSLELSSITYIL